VGEVGHADALSSSPRESGQQWIAAHPRFQLLWLPTYCPRTNPIERIFGDTQDKVTRNHKRKRLRDLVADVIRHLDLNGPWPYQLARLYEEPETTAARKQGRKLSNYAGFRTGSTRYPRLLSPLIIFVVRAARDFGLTGGPRSS
jgi:transposase